MANSEVNKADLLKEIRGVLDSTPNGLDSKQISQDYRALCGNSLMESVRKLGHYDIDSFLVLLSDEGAVKLEHAPGGGYIYRAGVADKSTCHLQALVKNQVSNRKGGKGSGRRSGGGRSVASRTPVKRELPKAMQADLVKMVRERRTPTNLSNLIKLYHEKYGVTLNFRPSGFSCLREAISSISELILTTKNDSVLVTCAEVAPLMSTRDHVEARKALARDIAKVIQNREVRLTEFAELYSRAIGRTLAPSVYGYTSLLGLLNGQVETVNLRRVGETGDWIISLSSRSKAQPAPTNMPFTGSDTTKTPPPRKRIPYELIKMIRVVVESNPLGIYIANFDQIFKLETGGDICPHTYGYDTMTSLLAETINEGIEIVSAKFGNMIKVRRKEGEAVKPVTDPHRNISLTDCSLDLHDAVGPGVCYNRSPRPPLDQYIEVIVSQVYDPGNFYIQAMANNNTGKRLEELMDMLEEAYKSSEATGSYLLPPTFAMPGQLAVCRFPNDQFWHRARITKVIDGNFVQVLFVDYGTFCSIHKRHLYYLREKFLTMPAQAQPATLFGIKPVSGNTWQSSGCKAFLNVTAEKRLCAMVRNIERDQRLSMCLTDTSGTLDLHINDFLVSSNFAVFTDTGRELPHHNLNHVDQVLNWSVSSEDDSSDDDCTPPPLNKNTLATATSQSTVGVENDTGELERKLEQLYNRAEHTRQKSSAVKKELSEDSMPALELVATGQPLLTKTLDTDRLPLDTSGEVSCKVLPSESPKPAMSPVKRSINIAPVFEPVNAASTPATSSKTPPLEPFSAVPSLGPSETASDLVPPNAAPSLVSANAAPSLVSSNTAPPLIPSNMTLPLVPSNTAPPLMPSNTVPPLVPSNTAPPLVPSNTVPLLVPSNTAPPLEPLVGDNAWQVSSLDNAWQVPSLETISSGMRSSHFNRMQQTATVKPQRQPAPRYMTGQRHMMYPHYVSQQQQQSVYPPSQMQAMFGPQQGYLQQQQQMQYAAGPPIYCPPPQYPVYPQPSYQPYGQPYGLPSHQCYQPPYTTPLQQYNYYPVRPNTCQNQNSRPPPLVSINSIDVLQPELGAGDVPPPLVRINSIEPVATTSEKTEAYTRSNQSEAHQREAVETLKYKLSGLQLKRKRLQRELYDEQAADYSGAESSDSELSSLETEIDRCQQQLVQAKGASMVVSPTLKLGRGRGRLHLLALNSDD